MCQAVCVSTAPDEIHTLAVEVILGLYAEGREGKHLIWCDLWPKIKEVGGLVRREGAGDHDTRTPGTLSPTRVYIYCLQALEI